MVLKSKAKNEEKTIEDSPTKDTQEPESQNNSEEETSKTKEDQTQKLAEALSQEKDRFLRLSAEFENYKKRKEREIIDFRKFANESVFKQLLSTIDNMERAVQSAESNEDHASLLEGVKLTHKEILKIFTAFNVTVIEAEHQPFDPNFHQAVTQEESSEFPDNTVTTVLQKGYLLHDRLLRPAMVVVSKRTEKDTEKTEEK